MNCSPEDSEHRQANRSWVAKRGGRARSEVRLPEVPRRTEVKYLNGANVTTRMVLTSPQRKGYVQRSDALCAIVQVSYLTRRSTERTSVRGQPRNQTLVDCMKVERKTDVRVFPKVGLTA